LAIIDPQISSARIVAENAVFGRVVDGPTSGDGNAGNAILTNDTIDV
jgi:hypothetical protein